MVVNKMTTKEEHEKCLAGDVKAKIEELNFAHYSGDIKQLLVFCMNKDGSIQRMQALDSIGAPHFNLMIDIWKKESVDLYLKYVITESKPRD